MLDYEHGSLQEDFLLLASSLPTRPLQGYHSEYLKQKLSCDFLAQILMATYPLTFIAQPQHLSSLLGASPLCPLQTKRLDGLCKKASFHRVPIPWLCYSLPELLLFSADPNPILLSRLCPTGTHVLWGCCVCVDHHDYLCVPEAGGIAILISLVPSPLPGTEQAGINCLWTVLLSYCFTLPFFLIRIFG